MANPKSDCCGVDVITGVSHWDYDKQEWIEIDGLQVCSQCHKPCGVKEGELRAYKIDREQGEVIMKKVSDFWRKKSRKSHREICSLCHEVSRVMFEVPNEIWKLAVHISQVNTILCLRCFTRLADERGVKWDENIRFYPVSWITHNNKEESRIVSKMTKLKSDCHGADVIKIYNGLFHDGMIHASMLREYECSQCYKPCTPIGQPKEERGDAKN